MTHSPELVDRPLNEHLVQVQAMFVEFTPALRGFLHAILPDFTLVDEVVQETFLTVTQKAHDFQSGTNFWAWICTIARYKSVESVRRSGNSPLPLAEEVLDSLCAVQPELEREDTRLRLLTDCLAKLSPKSRRVVEMRYSQAHRPAEIARRLNWTTDSVYVALSRARKLLRECVERRQIHLTEG